MSSDNYKKEKRDTIHKVKPHETPVQGRNVEPVTEEELDQDIEELLEEAAEEAFEENFDRMEEMVERLWEQKGEEVIERIVAQKFKELMSTKQKKLKAAS